MIPERVHAIISAHRPAVVVNAAAYTDVDKAETEPDVAMRINSEGAGAVARSAQLLDVPIVHLSTDYVFDGRKGSPYLEDDPVGPINSYGRSKLAGERQVRTFTAKHIILRTSWVYSSYGTNFVKTMLRLAASHDEIRVVADQIGSPTSAPDLADGVLKVVRLLTLNPRADLYGTFHISGTGAATRADFAERIFSASCRRGGPSARVRRTTTRDYPSAAIRPADSRLDVMRLGSIYGIRLRPWTLAVDEVVAQLIGDGGPGSAAQA
jgi:dTDP-4-dehydrorhamnose reductase